VKYKFSKFVPTAVTQQIMHANPEENVAMVDELVLCQEDQPQIHHSVYPVAGSAVIWIIFHLNLVLKRPTEDQTEAIHYARLSCSKQLLNDVIFIWFTDKNVFTLPMLKNSHNNPLMHLLQQRRKMSEQNTFFVQE